MGNRFIAMQHYSLLLALFVSLLLVANIAATKLIAIGPLIVDGGIVLFPLTYIIGDILAEVYGIRTARRSIFISFGISILATLTFLAVQFLPAAPEYANQAAFEAVLGFVPQIVIASLIAFACGQLINAYVLVKIKERWGERRLWVRLLGSSIVGQLADTSIFCFIAFYGILTGWSFISYVLVGIAYKIVIEIALLPVTYRLIRHIKERESRHYE